MFRHNIFAYMDNTNLKDLELKKNNNTEETVISFGSAGLAEEAKKEVKQEPKQKQVATIPNKQEGQPQDQEGTDLMLQANKEEGERKGGEIDMSKLSMENVATDKEISKESPMLMVNKKEKSKESGEINIGNLSMQNIKEQDEDKANFDMRNIKGIRGKILQHFHLDYWKTLTISLIVFVFFGIATFILKFYYEYMQIALEPVIQPGYESILDKVSRYEEFLNDYLHYSNINRYQNMTLTDQNGLKNLLKIINAPDIGYINKKLIIQEDINELTSSIFALYKHLDNSKQDIAKYGYLPKEISKILKNNDQIVSIKDSLISLEIIKFSSAMKVFSYLDTFIQNFASTLHMKPEIVTQKMQQMIDRGEKDVYLYLNTCYMNPFEWDYDCNNIGDFDTYYKLFANGSPMDTNFFKKMIKYIDLKLEQTEVPSFNIIFKQFDPSKQNITFTIDVNTFQQDELALVKKGILNPHIFVVTQLLNLLKQSRFILGENIEIKNLKVTPISIYIGTVEFKLNHSELSFTLPIQKSMQREIFDYVDQGVKKITD